VIIEILDSCACMYLLLLLLLVLLIYKVIRSIIHVMVCGQKENRDSSYRRRSHELLTSCSDFSRVNSRFAVILLCYILSLLTWSFKILHHTNNYSVGWISMTNVQTTLTLLNVCSTHTHTHTHIYQMMDICNIFFLFLMC